MAADVTSVHDHASAKEMRAQHNHPLLLVAMTTALALSGSVLPGCTAIANAQPSRLSSELDLTISTGPVPIAAPRARKLMCDPPGGNHPYAEAACVDIAAADGELGRLPGEPGKVCSGVYEPVTVDALGEWRGAPVRFHQTYRNACKMRASTGLVFGF